MKDKKKREDYEGPMAFFRYFLHYFPIYPIYPIYPFYFNWM
jgi:hypothetical protein